MLSSNYDNIYQVVPLIDVLRSLDHWRTHPKTWPCLLKSSCEYYNHDQEYNTEDHQQQACLRVNKSKTLEFGLIHTKRSFENHLFTVFSEKFFWVFYQRWVWFLCFCGLRQLRFSLWSCRTGVVNVSTDIICAKKEKKKKKVSPITVELGTCSQLSLTYIEIS